MITKEIMEFNEELISDIRDYAHRNGISSEDAFTSVFTSYILESGNTNLSDCIIQNFKKTSEKVKINGYAFNAFYQSLTLVICDFANKNEIKKIGKTEINELLKMATRFYRLCSTGEYFAGVEETAAGYQVYEAVEENKAETNILHVVLLTNKVSNNFIPEDGKVGNVKVQYDVWDLERVFQIVYQKYHDELIIDLKEKYDVTLNMIKADTSNDIYDAYIGVISGKLLATIYEDEGQKLIEKNVRSFLQATGKINKGIRDTLKKEPEMFMAYNNGISTIAQDIDFDLVSDNIYSIKSINNWQIVNGGQTTASVYNALKSDVDLQNVSIQMKLTVIKDTKKADEIIASISKYANSQNKITMSDFSANDDYHIEMERLSRSIFVPVEKGKSNNQWFYERARGQYFVEMNRQPTATLKKQFKERCPKKQCISKTVAAKCLMAWMKYPFYVSKGLESNFVLFSQKVKEGEVPKPTEDSYISMIAKVILFQECDSIVTNLKFGGYKAQINYYTIAALAEYYEDKVDDEEIWKNQAISPELAYIIEELAYKVWDHFMHPIVEGVNITQWCKKEECWTVLKDRLGE